jgi:homoserine O-acetyltransferase/O-succinyltransferase
VVRLVNTSNILTKIGEVSIGPLQLESGYFLPEVSLTYERVGPQDAPIILVCHALTGNHLTVGCPELPGWWNGLIGPNQYIDTAKYQVITFNVLGGCNGSTGPLSINPITEEPYRASFPTITIRDMVHAQFAALQQLDIKEVYAVVGGSLGGMQALEWGLLYPDLLNKLIILAATPTLSDYGIAYNHIAKQAITNDPLWLDGYYQSSSEIRGLEIARMIGMVTYRSSDLFSERFNRKETESGYSVTSYLDYQGEKLSNRFEANSYLGLLEAMNTHDIGRERGGWEEACKQYTCSILALSFEHDLIYEPKIIKDFSSHLANCSYQHIETLFGHDGFLTEYHKWGSIIEDFLISVN